MVCLFIQLGFHCAPGSIYILSTLLFLYGVLRAHVRCTRFMNTRLHYITYPIARRTSCETKLSIFPQNAPKTTYKKPSSSTLAVTSMATTWNTLSETTREAAWPGAAA